MHIVDWAKHAVGSLIKPKQGGLMEEPAFSLQNDPQARFSGSLVDIGTHIFESFSQGPGLA